MHLSLLPFSSSLAAVLLMAAAGVQAGSVQVRSASTSFFGGTTVTSTGNLVITGNNNAASQLQKLTFSTGSVTTGNRTTLSSVLPLRFPGAPLTGPAGLPFALSSVISALSQAGVLPTSSPVFSGSTSRTTLTGNVSLSGNISTGLQTVVNSIATTNKTVELTKAGTGTLILTSANTFTGTGVTQGTLTVSNPGSVVSTTALTQGQITSTLLTVSTAANVTLSAPINTGTTGVSLAGTGILTLTSGNHTFAGPIVMRAGSLVVSVPLSLNEADPGTAFSDSNPASLIESDGGALFPVGTTVKVLGLKGPSASSPVATIENQSAGAMIIKRTSTGGMSFMTTSGGMTGAP